MTNSVNSANAGSFTGKIAVATNDQHTVTGHIGRCRSFMIVDIENGKIVNREMRENTFTHHRMGHEHQHHHGQGEGHHSHHALIQGLQDCNFLISSGGGWRVVEDLKQNNIGTLFTDIRLIDEAVNQFIRGELVNLDDLTCRDHGH